jgi:hypothetical protein
MALLRSLSFEGQKTRYAIRLDLSSEGFNFKFVTRNHCCPLKFTALIEIIDFKK